MNERHVITQGGHGFDSRQLHFSLDELFPTIRLILYLPTVSAKVIRFFVLKTFVNIKYFSI